MKKHWIVFAALLLSTSKTAAADPTSWRSLIDMKRADVSKWSMKMINEGQEVGSMTYGWQRSGNTYVIRDRTEMQPNILETAIGIIDARTLMPISNDIDFAAGTSKNIFDLEWHEGALRGEIQINQEGKAPRTVDISNADHPASIIRLSIFGVIAGLPLAEGFSVDMPWYNTLSNTVENITLAHTGFETVETPAGSFDTHKIHIRNGTPENVVYITRSMPQRIVRIDVIGRPMHFERLP